MIDKAIKLRPFLNGDAEAVSALLQDTFASTWEPELTPSARADIDPTKMSGDYVAESGTEFILAELDGQIAGMVHWRHDFVYALHVHTIAQGNGVGDALLKHAEMEIALAGYSQIRLETDTFNKNSRRFYEKRGYRETERKPDEDWNSGFTTICFEKPFTPA